MVRFGTAGIRGPVGEMVTPEIAVHVGRAAGREGDEFVVGRDGRVTGPALAEAVAAGLASAGARVGQLGVVPTPALAYASQGRRGIMLTASHNPPSDNGIKLFHDGRAYDRDAERRLEARIDEGAEPTDWSAWETSERESILPSYQAAVGAYASTDGAEPAGIELVVDCGTGTAGLATPQVLTDLGATVHALNANVDGHFPARASKPTGESLTELRSFVADGDASLGLGHDGDGDRIVVVDADGEIVHEDTVLAVLGHHYVSRSSADDPVVVTTPNASSRIDERVRAAGGRVERVRLGALHEGIAAARDKGDASTRVVFAAEPWKHVHPAFGEWMDAIASAAILVRLVAANGLAALLDPISERPVRKDSLPCLDPHKQSTIAHLQESLPDHFPEAEVDISDGIRLSFPDDGWVLVRASGTEPFVRIYAESERVDDLLDHVRDVVEAAIDSG